MVDFLTFKAFLSPITLIIFYYLGVLGMPLFIWVALRWLMKKISMMEESYQKAKDLAWSSMNLKYKIIFLFFFIMIFLFMQLLWRMMFEFLIAYMQIHEALVS